MSKLIQMADLHFGVEDSDALHIAAEVIVGLEPDALIICGDLTQRGKSSEFQAAANWLSQFSVPKLIVAGNHDTPLLDIVARVMQPFDRFDDYFGNESHGVATDTVAAHGLNTARGWQARANWAEGSVNLENLKNITQATSQTSPLTHLLACHHPFLSPPDAPMRTDTARGERASRALAASDIDILLTGHVHTPSAHVWRHDEGSYLAISCGTLSRRLRSMPPGFNVLDIGPSAIVANSIFITNSQVESRQLISKPMPFQATSET